MDFYGIAAASMSLQSMRLSQSVDVALLDKTMDLAKESMGEVLETIDAVDVSAPPPARLLDVLV